jgi:osmotically-inducible protein OsmY
MPLGQPQLIKAIYAALEKDPYVNLARSRIHITLDDHIVLHGKVPNIVAKRVAARLARRVAAEAEIAVEDRLRVETEALGDAALRDKVGDALSYEPAIANHSILTESNGHQLTLRNSRTSVNFIHAQVKDGVVTLRGRVDSISHRWLIEAILWWIPGCQRIDNLIGVHSSLDGDLDNSLTDTVRIMLEKDPLLDAEQLHVGSAAGIVELEGWLPSQEQRKMALFDTWAIPGVEDVRDRIVVE